MSAVYMLNSVGERTPHCENASFELMCDFYMLRRLDVICDELNECAWNVGL